MGTLVFPKGWLVHYHPQTTKIPGLCTVMCPQLGEEVLCHAALYFPSSNPKVQVEAIEGGALQKLLVILATEQPLPAKKKVCICSLPAAQPLAHLQSLRDKGPFFGCACHPWGPECSPIHWVA